MTPNTGWEVRPDMVSVAAFTTLDPVLVDTIVKAMPVPAVLWL